MRNLISRLRVIVTCKMLESAGRYREGQKPNVYRKMVVFNWATLFVILLVILGETSALNTLVEQLKGSEYDE